MVSLSNHEPHLLTLRLAQGERLLAPSALSAGGSSSILATSASTISTAASIAPAAAALSPTDQSASSSTASGSQPTTSSGGSEPPSARTSCSTFSGCMPCVSTACSPASCRLCRPGCSTVSVP